MTAPTDPAARLRAARDNMATLSVASWREVLMRDMLVTLADALLPLVERAEATGRTPEAVPIGAAGGGTETSVADEQDASPSGHASAPVPPAPPRVERFGIVPKLDDDPVILMFSRTVAEYEARKLTGYRVVRLVELRESERIVPTENERDPEAHRTIAALRRDLAEAREQLTTVRGQRDRFQRLIEDPT